MYPLYNLLALLASLVFLGAMDRGSVSTVWAAIVSCLAGMGWRYVTYQLYPFRNMDKAWKRAVAVIPFLLAIMLGDIVRNSCMAPGREAGCSLGWLTPAYLAPMLLGEGLMLIHSLIACWPNSPSPLSGKASGVLVTGFFAVAMAFAVRWIAAGSWPYPPGSLWVTAFVVGIVGIFAMSRFAKTH